MSQPTTTNQSARTNEEVVFAIKMNLAKVVDPDLGYDLVSLGLIYDVSVQDAETTITLTLTSPACPFGPELMALCIKQAQQVPEIDTAHLNLVWEPRWNPMMMNEALRLDLGFDV